MTGDLTSQLLEAATSTFEQLGFLFADYELTEEQAGLPVDAVARVRFSGPRSGILEVRIAGGLLPQLASNMLGTEDAPEQTVVQDAFGEIANVICGNVLPKVAGPEAVFDLNAPQVTMGPGESLEPLEEEATLLSVGLEGGRTDLAFSFAEETES